MQRILSILRARGIQPTPQRIAVARCVLDDKSHPSAQRVWERVRRLQPTVSRATVYNTLGLFARKGLLKAQVLSPGVVVFDPHTAPHHHFIDQQTGAIHDIAWDAVKVTGEDALADFEVREYQVVMRGRKRRPRRRPPPAGGAYGKIVKRRAPYPSIRGPHKEAL